MIPLVNTLGRWSLAPLFTRVTQGFPVGIFPFHWQGKYFGFDEMYIHDGLVSSGHFSVARRCPDWRYAVMHRALTRQSHYTKRGKYGARWLWMSLEEGDVETAGIGFWMDHIFAMGSIARSAWTQYAYSGDRDSLEKVGYPIVLECARFYRNNWILEGPDGVAWIGRCTDLERLGPSKDKAFLSTCSAIYALRVAADRRSPSTSLAPCRARAFRSPRRRSCRSPS